MPSIASPVPISPARRQLSLLTSPQDLFASLNATLASKSSELYKPMHTIRVNDYTVPAPPPPSPVSCRVDQWSSPVSR